MTFPSGWKLTALALGGLSVAACVPGLTGAACNDDGNCPSGQVCVGASPGVVGACQAGTGGSGGGGGSGGAGGSGGSGGAGGSGGGGASCLDTLGNPINTQTSATNCGTCGNVCPTPAHASAACNAGLCGRGACAAGFFDLDGPVVFGCESTCTGRNCTLGDGGSITVSNDPVSEIGLVGKSVVNGSSVGAGVQTNANHSNLGSIGEATPKVGPGGGIETSNSQNKHRGGFGAKVK
jgi:hypothetical protein